MTRRLLVAAVVLGLLAAAVVLVQRFRLEARYRTVEIVLDGDDWGTLIRREGADPAAVLRSLRAAGAVSVALQDPTLKRLAEEGKVSYAGGGALVAAGRITSLAGPFRRLADAGALRTDAVYITGPPEHAAFVEERMRTLLGEDRIRRLDEVLEVRGTLLDLEELGLGFRPADAAPYVAAGLEVVLRPRNYRGLTADSLRALVDGYAQTAPAPTLIFALTEVQGYEGLIAEAAVEYRRIGARFGRIEVFTARRKQRGEDALTAGMAPAVIRVFSITPEELVALRPREAADRFVRAAQERNIRLLYVRPLLATPVGEAALDANVGMVGTITADLRDLGFAPGRTRPLPALDVPRPLAWTVGLGASALVVLVLADLAAVMGISLAPLLLWGVVGLGTAGTVAAGFTPLDGLWRLLLALAVASTGAAGATVWALPAVRGPARLPALAGGPVLIRAAALAVAAGALVAALLSRWPFMLAFSTFLGVKAAHVIPVMLAALWLAFRGVGRDWRATLRDLRGWIDQPIRVGAALAVLGVGLAAVMLLVRTGNIGLPLSGVEQRLRTTLETVLVARPRTKEFLIGYPALVLAGTAAALGWRRTATALALAGTIGTAGAINSFSHLHTPLLYTVWRTGNALLLGAVLAAPGVVVLLWIARRLPRS